MRLAGRRPEQLHHRHPAARRRRAHRLNILSIQSRVSFGHVGNSSAQFALQRLGCEVWTIDTVQLSNHTGYGDWTGEALDGPGVAALVDGIARRGALASCDAILSGYLGSAGIGEAVLDAAARVRTENPRALYACDPVIGDTGTGTYVGAGIVDILRDRAVPLADLLTPNAFELAMLTGMPVSTWAEAARAADALRGGMRPDGPRALLVTSLETAETPAEAVDLLAMDASGCVRVRVPRLPIAANGAGDLIAAVFLFHFAQTGSAARAAERAAASVQGVLVATVAAGARELRLIAAQAELVEPTARFVAEAR